MQWFGARAGHFQARLSNAVATPACPAQLRPELISLPPPHHLGLVWPLRVTVRASNASNASDLYKSTREPNPVNALNIYI